MPEEDYLLIFDCDGVLVDSEVLAVKAEERVLREVGFPMTIEEIVNTCVGLSYPAMMALLEERFQKPIPEGLEERIQEEAIALFPTELCEIEGMSDFLATNTLRRCVASSGNPDRIALSLGITGLDAAFAADAIFSATMVANGKPAPDLFLHAAASMGFAPEQCIVIEDSPHGVAAAHAATMGVIAITAGGHMGEAMMEKLAASGPTHMVATTAELDVTIAEMTSG